MELRSDHSYVWSLIRPKGYYDIFRLLLPVTALVFVKRDTWIWALLFLLYALWTKLARKFTVAIRVDVNHFDVVYRQFFITRTVRFNRADVVLHRVHYHDDLRVPSYYILLVMEDDEVKYQVDSRDGFSKETLSPTNISFIKNFTLF